LSRAITASGIENDFADAPSPPAPASEGIVRDGTVAPQRAVHARDGI
jgi:hypothetical protein